MRTVRAVLAATLVTVISACNAILGNESNYTLVRGDAGSTKPAGCTLNSECTGGKVCLFATCSKPCAVDADCPNDARCLRTTTTAGTACVSVSQATCADGKCPTGTACHDGACRVDCTTADDCNTDQTCTNGACHGTDPTHDPVGGVDSGPGASGGNGGMTSSGGAGGTSGGGTGGRKESGGSTAVDASVDSGAFDSGTGGAIAIDGGGDAGPGDLTRVGSLGDPCAPSGSYACAGHAQKGLLVCTKGVWAALNPCTGSNNCDSTPGSNAGSCQPIVTQCVSQSAGARFCQSTKDLYECGLDLVTTKLVETCPYVCTGGACTGECDPAGSITKQCKAGTNTPQTCNVDGTWKDGTDCSYLCKDGNCVAASCGDGAKNGDETDTDCGGSCSGCPVNGVCKANPDCKLPASGVCKAGKCVAALCNDGVLNGDESDIDCGGGTCAGCGVTRPCGTNTDCALPASGKCTGGKCAAALCTDGVQNGSETGPDCGGSCPSDCPVGSGCTTSADCASSACVNSVCTGVCSPGSKQCSLVGAGGVQTCATDGTWGNPVVCSQSQTCSSGACVACPSGTMDCDGSASTGCEKAINTPASCGTSCTTTVCSSANGTAACSAGVCTTSSCKTGFGDCGGVNDGCETNLWQDGACGTTCAGRVSCDPTNPTCVQGGCACTGGNVVTNNVCCQPGLTGCGTKCYDLTKDNANCGGCGLACTTTAGCTAGRCTVALATGEFSQGLAVDSTNVYWTNITKATVNKVPIGGGTASSIASGGSAPFAMVVDSAAVYWTTSSGDTVLKAAISSGSVTTLASGRVGPSGIATDGAGIYWGEGNGVFRVANTGGTVATLWPAGSLGAEDVAVSAGQVYFTVPGDSSGNGFIGRVSTSGGTMTPLRTGLFQPISLAVDGTNIYWASYGSSGTDSVIYKMPLAGGTPVPLATAQSYFQDGTIAIDSGYVYWANFGGGSVAKVPLGGGSVTTLATGLPNPMSVAVNGSSVFFSSYGGTVGKITPK